MDWLGGMLNTASKPERPKKRSTVYASAALTGQRRAVSATAAASASTQQQPARASASSQLLASSSDGSYLAGSADVSSSGDSGALPYASVAAPPQVAYAPAPDLTATVEYVQQRPAIVGFSTGGAGGVGIGAGQPAAVVAPLQASGGSGCVEVLDDDEDEFYTRRRTKGGGGSGSGSGSGSSPLLLEAAAPAAQAAATATASSDFVMRGAVPPPSPAAQQRSSSQKQAKSAAAAAKATKNIVVLGKQHAGKSAFVNTYRRCVTGGDNWANAPVGRAVSRGTSSYEPYYAQVRRQAVEWVLVDTAGRRCNKPLVEDSEEALMYDRMLSGMEWKADLVESGWRDVKAVPRNAIDHVIFVMPASDIVQDKGLPHAFFGGRFEASLAKVRDLATRFAWWEKKLGNAPFVVVTHMDEVEKAWATGGESVEATIRNCLGQIIHKNRVVCITNPDDPLEVSRKTEETVRRLHDKMMSDIEARTSSVLRGRNARWQADDDDDEDDAERSSGDDNAHLPRAMTAPAHSPTEPPPPMASTRGSSPRGYSRVVSTALAQQMIEQQQQQQLAPPRAPAAEAPSGGKRFNAQTKTGGGSLLWSMPVAQKR